MSNRTSCSCCACLSGAGPHLAIENRPGLSALRYRIGTHATFYDAMIRRLTVPADGVTASYSLHRLTTRETDDPAIALLDAWALVGDVLTFYQERIANEGFLRTATEWRSILELGRLVGYKLKPGVSASVYLAYTLDDTARTIIPKGSKSQTIPGANEQPQTFETCEDIEARDVWSALKPRLSRPLEITIEDVLTLESVWITGTNTRISAAEPLLFVFKRQQERKMYALRTAASAVTDNEKSRTEIKLAPVGQYLLDVFNVAIRMTADEAVAPSLLEEREVVAAKPRKRKAAAAAESAQAAQMPNVAVAIVEQILLGGSRAVVRALGRQLPQGHELRNAIFPEENTTVPPPPPPPVEPEASWSLNTLVNQLTRRSAIAPASQWQFARNLNASLKQSSDFLPRLTANFLPRLGTTFYAALASATTGQASYTQFESLHVLRRRAGVFGYNAPTVLFEDRPTGVEGLPTPGWVAEANDEIYLDTPAEAVRRDSYVVVQRPDPGREISELMTVVRTARDVETRPRTAYSMSAKSTRVALNEPWTTFAIEPDKGTPETETEFNLAVIRNTSVLLESEALTLAQQPVTRDIGEPAVAGDMTGESQTRIELDVVVDGLPTGRWVIVSGERSDTPGTKGVIASELAMVASVELVPDAGAGGTAYSILVLAPEGLRYRYRRSTVKIYGNVAKADHGETRNQIFGGGDSAKKMQTFTLQHAPLTFTSAPTPAGVVSTLAVRVNDVLWHESDTFIGATPSSRIFVTRTADDGKVSVIFGNGREGALVPTGIDNVRGVYRSGIGISGNARALQIATAISRPLGVRDVINPIAASGGADPEKRDDARRNIPVSLQAMGRVVSVRDFADFARTFAGINKASAVVLSDGRRRVVHLTVGGAGDVEIDANSDLYRNLVEALRKFGDPYQPFVVDPREKIVIAGSANVRIHPDYLWTSVAPRIRERLLDVFSYDRRDFGQVVFPAEVIAAIQNVEGVAYVDLDTFGPVAQDDILDLGENAEQTGFLKYGIEGTNPIIPRLARRDQATGALRPAQIAYLPPELADLFILTEITHES